MNVAPPPSAPATAAPAAGDTERRMSPAARPGVAFMLRHPAHAVALGFGSGLSPWAPGTVGTLWAWLAFVVLSRWLDAPAWALLIAASCALGLWACTRTAQHLRVADPGAIVWDEVLGFWIVLWLVMPAPWWAQGVAFVLFRYFDAAKPGPVGWADRLCKLQPGAAIGWRQGLGILLDDLVAAGCALLVIALWVRLWAT